MITHCLTIPVQVGICVLQVVAGFLAEPGVFLAVVVAAGAGVVVAAFGIAAVGCEGAGGRGLLVLLLSDDGMWKIVLRGRENRGDDAEELHDCWSVSDVGLVVDGSKRALKCEYV